jgi:hypothetical protein
MAAKKTAKKAAKKATARKNTKKAAQEAPEDAPKSARTRKEPSPSDLANLWEAAYYRYLDRLEKGLPGDELGDWLAAESELHK